MSQSAGLNHKRLLGQKVSDYSTIIFLSYSREEFLAKRFDGFRAVKRQLLIHRAALEMAGLATSFHDWFHISSEVDAGR